MCWTERGSWRWDWGIAWPPALQCPQLPEVASGLDGRQFLFRCWIQEQILFFRCRALTYNRKVVEERSMNRDCVCSAL